MQTKLLIALNIMLSCLLIASTDLSSLGIISGLTLIFSIVSIALSLWTMKAKKGSQNESEKH